MQRIKTDIKCGAFKNVYLFYGPETYLIDYYCNQIICANTDDDTKEFNLLTISAAVPEEGETDSFINSYPFMSERKVLCIKNSGLFKKSTDAQKKFWSETIENVPEYAIIIFAESEIDKRNSLYKLIEKKHTACEFDYQKPNELSSWTAKVLKSLSKTISVQDAAYIVELCGPSMQSIRTEIDKLASYITERSEINRTDIEQIVTKNIENRVFDMVDDIVEGRNAKAIQKLNDLKALNEEPIKIISIIFNKYSVYKKLSILKNRPISEICRLCGLYEKYAKNYLRQLNKMTADKIDRVMNKCMEMDFGVKSGKIDKWLAIEIILAEAMKH